MKEFNFDELKKGISFELLYPKEIISTRKDAARILGVKISEINKLRKNYKLIGSQALGLIFFFNSDLFRFKEGISIPSTSDPSFEDIEKHIRYKLRYPEKLLLTRKSAPTFLKISPYAFDKLRRRGEFCEYDYQGMKFYNREELAMWDHKKGFSVY